MDSILAQMRQEMDSFNTKSLQMLSHTNTHSNTHQQNVIINNHIGVAEVSSAQEIEVVVPLNEEASDEFRRRLNRHDQDLMRLSELQPKVMSSEEEIQRIWEKIEQMRGDGGSPSVVGGGGVDSNEFDALRTQLRVLQGQMEQMTTQNMLMGALGGGEMDENKITLILSEISKVQNNFSKYVLIGDWELESKKINQRMKVVGDSVGDSTEKVRRELTTKINQKLDVSEALKIVNEINSLKESIQTILSQKSGNNNNNSASTSNAAMDPNTANKIKDLSD